MTEDLHIGFCPVAPEDQAVFCPMFAHCAALLGLNDNTPHDKFHEVHDGIVNGLQTRRPGYLEAKVQVDDCLLSDVDRALEAVPAKFQNLLIYQRLTL